MFYRWRAALRVAGGNGTAPVMAEKRLKNGCTLGRIIFQYLG